MVKRQRQKTPVSEHRIEITERVTYRVSHRGSRSCFIDTWQFAVVRACREYYVLYAVAMCCVCVRARDCQHHRLTKAYEMQSSKPENIRIIEYVLNKLSELFVSKRFCNNPP